MRGGICISNNWYPQLANCQDHWNDVQVEKACGTALQLAFGKWRNASGFVEDAAIGLLGGTPSISASQVSTVDTQQQRPAQCSADKTGACTAVSTGPARTPQASRRANCTAPSTRARTCLAAHCFGAR